MNQNKPIHLKRSVFYSALLLGASITTAHAMMNPIWVPYNNQQSMQAVIQPVAQPVQANSVWYPMPQNYGMGGMQNNGQWQNSMYGMQPSGHNGYEQWQNGMQGMQHYASYPQHNVATESFHQPDNITRPLSGTVTVGQDSNTVTGSETRFTQELNVGDAIKMGGQTLEVASIESNILLKLDGNHTEGVLNATAYTDDHLFYVQDDAGKNHLVTNKDGKVGVGTDIPQADLDIAGSIRFGGKTIDQITSCHFTGVSTRDQNWHWREWQPKDCDNGLPKGSCSGFLAHTTMQGEDSDWSVILPGGVGNRGANAQFPNGGIQWVCDSCRADDAKVVGATYMCSK